MHVHVHVLYMYLRIRFCHMCEMEIERLRLLTGDERDELMSYEKDVCSEQSMIKGWLSLMYCYTL